MRRRLSIVFWSCAALGLCAFIYSMSACEGEASSGMSESVAELLASLLIPQLDLLTPVERMAVIGAWQLPIRKAGHLLEYAALGIATFRLLNLIGSKHTVGQPLIMGVALAFCALYAASDELHQLSVSGRTGSPWDVLIDSLGALIGITLACQLFRWLDARWDGFHRVSMPKKKRASRQVGRPNRWSG